MDYRQIVTIMTILNYVSIVIVIIGLMCNILTVKVLRRRNSLGTRLLLYLTYTDIAVLVGFFVMRLLPRLIYTTTAWDIVGVLEPFILPILKTLFTLEAYLVVIIGFQRSLILAVPLKYIRFTKDRVFNRALIGIAIFAVLFNIHEWVALKPEKYFNKDLNISLIRASYMTNSTVLDVFRKFKLPVNNIVPIILIVVCDVIMIISMIRSRSNQDDRFPPQTQGRNRLTNIVVSITTVSMVLHVAVAVPVLCAYMRSTCRRTTVLGFNIVLPVIIVIRSSINFLFYCMFGPEFRKTLYELLRCRSRRCVTLFASHNGETVSGNGRKYQGSMALR